MKSDTLNSILKWLVILIAIACVSWAAISIYKHFHPAPPVFHPTVLQDSVTQREKEMGHVIDSLISKNNKTTDWAISSHDTIVQQRIELDKRKDLTENLSNQYKVYRQKYDTINALHKCDTLAEEVTRLDLAVMEYEDSNGKLYDSLQSITGNNSLILAKKDYLYGVIRTSLDSVIYQTQILGTNLQKQKNKHWTINIGGSAFYYNGFKITPSINIGYKLFSF